MAISHRFIRRYIGKSIQCHTHFGVFHGVVVHCTKTHLILGIVRPSSESAYDLASDGHRQMPMGPGGPGPGMGSAWQFAVPLAAVLGITAIGMHWW